MAFGAAWPWLRAKVAPFTRDTARYLFICAAWYPVCYFVESHVVGTTRVRGPSMYPYLNENYNETRFGYLCLTWKLYAQQNLQRGMIVTFYNPMRPETLTIKRIIGLPGDMIHTKAPFPTSYIRVPPNHVWVEGDGTKSLDSNTYGPISIRLVEGQITHILWPFRKAQRVKWWEHRLTDRLAATR